MNKEYTLTSHSLLKVKLATAVIAAGVITALLKILLTSMNLGLTPNYMIVLLVNITVFTAVTVLKHRKQVNSPTSERSYGSASISITD